MVHLPEGKQLYFKLARIGLYYLDMEQTDLEAMLLNMLPPFQGIKGPISGYPVTIDDIKAVFWLNMLPPFREFNGLIPGCPITIDDIKAAEDIYGPNLA